MQRIVKRKLRDMDTSPDANASRRSCCMAQWTGGEAKEGLERWGWINQILDKVCIEDWWLNHPLVHPNDRLGQGIDDDDDDDDDDSYF